MNNRVIFIGAVLGILVWYHADQDKQRNQMQTQRINVLESRIIKTELRLRMLQNVTCEDMNKSAPRPSMRLSSDDCEKYFAIVTETMAKYSDNQFPDNVLTPTPTACAAHDQWCQIRRWNKSLFNSND